MIRRILTAVLIAAVLCVIYVAAANLTVVLSEKDRLLAPGEETPDMADCILILGAGVRDEGTPTPMLADRLDEGLRLYEEGAAPKLLVSGDHGQIDYDEVNVMRKYLMERGVPEEDIFMDHAGFSTYESMYRAKEVFGAERVIVVTQKYHIYRALYIAERLGLEACGANSDPRAYRGAFLNNVRETAARSKDVLTCLFKVRPTYGGERIDLSGDGRVTAG